MEQLSQQQQALGAVLDLCCSACPALSAAAAELAYIASINTAVRPKLCQLLLAKPGKHSEEQGAAAGAAQGSYGGSGSNTGGSSGSSGDSSDGGSFGNASSTDGAATLGPCDSSSRLEHIWRCFNCLSATGDAKQGSAWQVGPGHLQQES